MNIIDNHIAYDCGNKLWNELVKRVRFYIYGEYVLRFIHKSIGLVYESSAHLIRICMSLGGFT